MKIAVAGTGYVGLSIATLLAQHHEVTAVDVIPEKVEMINNRKSPIQDEYIEKYLGDPTLIPSVGTPSLDREGRGGSLYATLDGKAAYRDADFVVIAVPTNYDPVKNFFDTHLIEDVIDLVLSVNPDAFMVIKSTIPVGYCRTLYVRYALKFASTPELRDKKFNLLFSPEFLRESKALYDNLYPSRIIVGYPKIIDNQEFTEENAAINAFGNPKAEEYAHTFASLLVEGAIGPAEAGVSGSKIQVSSKPETCNLKPETLASLSDAILQAARVKFTKTEYISCPGCGRTLYDLEETIARIKQAVLARAKENPAFRTLKIGIMGCIVNGPGEMADADYGYVGAAAGKVSLYKQKECIEKNIPADDAVDRLIAFIEEDLKK